MSYDKYRYVMTGMDWTYIKMSRYVMTGYFGHELRKISGQGNMLLNPDHDPADWQ